MAPYEDFEVNGNVLPEGLLIDFNDTSLTNSSTSRASTPPADQERCRTSDPIIRSVFYQ